MRIKPLAADSMGTRSMATYVTTKHCRILIDPSVALGPHRYGLSPHPLEEQKLHEDWEKIKDYAVKANVLVVTHYHFDHHDPDEPEVFKGKVLLTKHPKKKINKSQKKRSKRFLEKLGGIPREIQYSDGKDFSFGETTIRFSKAVPHGTNTKLGYVTELAIDDGKHKFVYTSDVEGPSLKEQVKFILDEDPWVVFCDGPMTYMMGYRYSKKSLEESIKNIIKVFKKTHVKRFVVDHHLLRDLNWRERMAEVRKAARNEGVRLMTCAEFAGEENIMLEARRKELYNQ
jgi:predicted metallo-beta-lactamase superfamily hydrolase